MMKLFYDLHMHSCLSACGYMVLTTNNIVYIAMFYVLEVVDVRVHICARNLPAVFSVAQKVGMLVIPAIEVCTSEEVHILCLFEQLDSCLAFSDLLYEYQPDIKNNPEIFGQQVVMNDMDEPIATVDRLLINASQLSLDELVRLLPNYQGVPIPAHVDKSSYSIISNLGYIPPEYGFRCIEKKDLCAQVAFEGNVISDSDAHYLEDIAQPQNAIEVEEKTITSVIKSILKPI